MTIVIRFELVPRDEAPQEYFRRSIAISTGFLAFYGMDKVLNRFDLVFALRLALSTIAYSLVSNVIYPFWRVRNMR